MGSSGYFPLQRRLWPEFRLGRLRCRGPGDLFIGRANTVAAITGYMLAGIVFLRRSGLLTEKFVPPPWRLWSPSTRPVYELQVAKQGAGKSLAERAAPSKPCERFRLPVPAATGSDTSRWKFSIDGLAHPCGCPVGQLIHCVQCAGLEVAF
jgi:hypothetical protein